MNMNMYLYDSGMYKVGRKKKTPKVNNIGYVINADSAHSIHM